MKPGRINLAAFLILAAVIVTFTLTYKNMAYNWVGHALAALCGLTLLGAVLLTGSIVSGRIKSAKRPQFFATHRQIALWFAAFMTLSFIYGLLVAASRGGGFFRTNHGWLGLALVIIALLQVVPGLLVKKRSKTLKIPHRWLGYTAILLLVIQVYLGLQLAI
jgi:hypothetical protein